MTKRGMELGTFCSRERRLNHLATAPLLLLYPLKLILFILYNIYIKYTYIIYTLESKAEFIQT